MTTLVKIRRLVLVAAELMLVAAELLLVAAELLLEAAKLMLVAIENVSKKDRGRKKGELG